MLTSHIKTLRAKHIKYFDLRFNNENKNLKALIINSSRHVFYRDIFIFISYLKDLITHHIAFIIIKLI